MRTPRLLPVLTQLLCLLACADTRREGWGTLNRPTDGKDVLPVQAASPNNATLAKPIGFIVISDP